MLVILSEHIWFVQGDCGRTVAGTEPNGRNAVSGIICRRVGAVGVVEGLKSGRPAEPEGAERTENDEGERVANEELCRCQSSRHVPL